MLNDDQEFCRNCGVPNTPEINEKLMEQSTCLEEGPDCVGKVEYHWNPDRDDFKTFPRCEFHQSKRLDQAEKNRELMSDVPPDWFDPTYAGERWDEEY